VVSEIATGDHSECTYGRERPGFGAAQGVFAIAIVNELALWSAGQVNMSAECIRDLAIAFSIVAISVRPAGIVIAVRHVAVAVRALPFAARTASKRQSVVIIAVARARLRLAPVVMAIVVAGAAAASTLRRVGLALVVACVVVARIEVHSRATFLCVADCGARATFAACSGSQSSAARGFRSS
jgi:hypothetical protein